MACYDMLSLPVSSMAYMWYHVVIWHLDRNIWLWHAIAIHIAILIVKNCPWLAPPIHLPRFASHGESFRALRGGFVESFAFGGSPPQERSSSDFFRSAKNGFC